MDKDKLKAQLVAKFLSAENRAEWMLQHHPVKLALKYDQIVRGIDPGILQRAKNCRATLKRAHPARGRWDFVVRSKGSVNSHAVKVSFVPKGNTRDTSKLHVKVSCSCKYWQYYGPDYHAAQKRYLQGPPHSNGAPPVVRDPSGVHPICKHIVAASELFRNYRLR